MPHEMIVIDQEIAWNAYIKKSLEPDIYHYWQYHSLDNTGSPILFAMTNGNDFIALPLIKRRIYDSDLFDLTSAYGYVGPVSNKKFEEIDEGLLTSFRECIGRYMRSSKCICAFSRLHPFINQQYLLNKIGDIYDNGKTIYLDLTIPIEAQRAKYDKSLARQIRNLRKNEYQIREISNQKEIAVFADIYTENMKRVNASKSYFFTEDYFTKLLQISDFNCRLLMVYKNGEAVCGSIIMYSDSIIRLHLTATRDNYVKESPGKLIVDETSVIGRKLGMKYYHLGGGVGGKEDSLFKFKKYFSDLTLKDNTWRYIADEEAYNSLLNGIDRTVESNFFPLYRSVDIFRSIILSVCLSNVS